MRTNFLYFNFNPKLIVPSERTEKINGKRSSRRGNALLEKLSFCSITKAISKELETCFDYEMRDAWGINDSARITITEQDPATHYEFLAHSHESSNVCR